MLDKHLIAKTRPVANKENIVFFKDYRITVLADRLFRIELDSEKIFTDKATQSVWYRDAKKQDFKVKTFADKIEIKTDKVTLVVNTDYAKSYAVIDGKKVKLTNKGNLLGTYRTLDCCRGPYETIDYSTGEERKITLGYGVCSRTGVAVIDDVKSLILDDDGMIKPRRFQQIDEYIFAYSLDYLGAIKAFYDITGYTPKIPRYALGNWWSRYYEYTEDEYLAVLRRFTENEVPLTVATIDMDWHYSNNLRAELGVTETDEFTGCDEDGIGTGWRIGWTGYTWNKNLFPDYKSFLNKIKEQNLKITLNLHPKDGVRYFEDAYNDMCKVMGIDPKTKKRVPFDLTNDNFINNYFKILHKPYEHDGVTFWWIDWQQGTSSTMENLDPLWALNHYHYLDNALENDTGLILSRYSNQGAHRYPLGFSGDTEMSFDTLDYLPYFTATASNIGYCWWSHDIGGFRYGEKNEELFSRSVQLGAFFPIMRLHCNSSKALTKEPWYYNTQGGRGHIVMEQMRFRHLMIPYIYSEGYKNHKYGVPLIKPLYYLYPENDNAYKYKNEYFFGELLVVPITKPSVAKGISKVKAFIPKGKWTDIFTGEEIDGGENGICITLYRFADSIPVFAKAGSVFTLSNDKHTNKVDNPKDLVLEIYSGDGEYSLYEDAGEKFAYTNIKNSVDNGELKTTIEFSGDYSVLPQDRTLTLKLKNITGKKVKVFKNGEEILTKVFTDKFTEVIISKVDYNAKYLVVAKIQDSSSNDKFIFQATEFLKSIDFDNNQKLWLLMDLSNKTYKSSLGWTDSDIEIFDFKKETLIELMLKRGCPKIYIEMLVSRLLMAQTIKENNNVR